MFANRSSIFRKSITYELRFVLKLKILPRDTCSLIPDLVSLHGAEVCIWSRSGAL